MNHINKDNYIKVLMTRTVQLEIMCLGQLTPRDSYCLTGCNGHEDCRVPIEVNYRRPVKEESDEELEAEYMANYRLVMGDHREPSHRY
jgi:hypothetical protein